MATLQDEGLVYRGETYVLNFTVTPTTNITAWTIAWNLKTAFTDTAALLTVAAVIVSAAAGTFSVTLTAAQTAALTMDTYVADVWRTDLGSEALLATGRLQVKGTVRVP